MMMELLQAACLWLLVGAGPRLTTVPAPLPHQGVAPGTRWEDRPTETLEASPSAPVAEPVSPATRPSPPARSNRSVKTQQVSFAAEDGVVIIADYLAPSVRAAPFAPMAILLHTCNSDRSAWEPLWPALRKAGFAVLAIDLRGHGESIQPTEMDLAERVARKDGALFRQMHRDVAAAYLWLRGQNGVDPSRLVIVAAGEGCNVALDYAVRDNSVDGVACLTPTLSYLAVAPVTALMSYGRRPLLLLAGEDERAAADRLKETAGLATLKVFPNSPEVGKSELHGTSMLGRVTGVESMVAEFCIQAAGSPSNTPVVASLRGETYYPPDSSHARHISPENLRWFSSPAEAEARGLRPSPRAAPRFSDPRR